MNLFDLTGKVAVVTGAASGLGQSAAVAYAQAGADVAILDMAPLDQTESMIKETGRQVLALSCNVADSANVKSVVEQIKGKFGHIDILMNNAGVARRGAVHDISEEDWDLTFDVNVKGIFLMSKYIVPIMMENNYGKIVNVSSVNSMIGDKNSAMVRHAYNASKAAVRGLTIGMGASYMQHGITVNAVGPGLFETGMTKDTLFKSEGYLQHYNALCPASRPAKQGELNGAVLFLSSDASSYVTGQFFCVDGGVTIV